MLPWGKEASKNSGFARGTGPVAPGWSPVPAAPLFTGRAGGGWPPCAKTDPSSTWWFLAGFRLISLKVLNSIVLLGKSCQYVKEAKMEEKLFNPPPASAPGKPSSKSQNKCKPSQGGFGSLFITSVNPYLKNQLSELSMIKKSLLSSAFKTRFCFAQLWIFSVYAEISSQAPLGKPSSVCPLFSRWSLGAWYLAGRGTAGPQTRWSGAEPVDVHRVIRESEVGWQEDTWGGGSPAVRGWGVGCTCRGLGQRQQEPRRPEGPSPGGEGPGVGVAESPTPGERGLGGRGAGGERPPRAPAALRSTSPSAMWGGAVGERGARMQGHSQSLWEIDSGR